jgi:hypothetical protein
VGSHTAVDTSNTKRVRADCVTGGQFHTCGRGLKMCARYPLGYLQYTQTHIKRSLVFF